MHAHQGARVSGQDLNWSFMQAFTTSGDVNIESSFVSCMPRLGKPASCSSIWVKVLVSEVRPAVVMMLRDSDYAVIPAAGAACQSCHGEGVAPGSGQDCICKNMTE